MKYIKNVTSVVETIAYQNEYEVFNLHLIQIPQNIKVGETILLYQNPKGIGRCFSDLVVIINDEIFEVQNNGNHAYCIKVKNVAKGIHLLGMGNTPLWDEVPHGGYTAGPLVNISQLNVVSNGVIHETDLINEAWGLFFS